SYTDTITAGTRQCYEVVVYDYAGNYGFNFSNEMCTSAVALPGVPATGAGLISMPDTNGFTGVRGSLTIGADGRGIMAYGVGGSCSTCPLRVAHCTDVACTAVTTHDIDPTGPGWYSSIKIGSDGLPLISYSSQNSASYQKLKVAHCADVICSS